MKAKTATFLAALLTVNFISTAESQTTLTANPYGVDRSITSATRSLRPRSRPGLLSSATSSAPGPPRSAIRACFACRSARTTDCSPTGCRICSATRPILDRSSTSGWKSPTSSARCSSRCKGPTSFACRRSSAYCRRRPELPLPRKWGGVGQMVPAKLRPAYSWDRAGRAAGW